MVCFLGVDLFIYLCYRCDYLRICATLGDGEGKGLQERVRARCETARVSRSERWSWCFQTVGASFWRSFGAEPGCGAACGMPSTRRLTALHSLHLKGWAGARGRCLSNDVLGEKIKNNKKITWVSVEAWERRRPALGPRCRRLAAGGGRAPRRPPVLGRCSAPGRGRLSPASPPPPSAPAAGTRGCAAVRVGAGSRAPERRA